MISLQISNPIFSTSYAPKKNVLIQTGHVILKSLHVKSAVLKLYWCYMKLTYSRSRFSQLLNESTGIWKIIVEIFFFFHIMLNAAKELMKVVYEQPHLTHTIIN